MNEQELYSIIGRKTAAYEKLDREYSRLLAILRAIKLGDIDFDQLTINDQGGRISWTLTPKAKPPKSEPEQKPEAA